MTSSIRPEEFWKLPGPSGFLSDIDATLQENDWLQQAIVAVPRRSEFSALAGRIADLTSPRSVVEIRLEPDGEGVVSAVLRATGSALPDDVPRMSDLLVAGRRRLLVIDAMAACVAQLAQLTEIIQSAAAAGHNASTHLEHVQIVAVMPGESCALIDRGPRLSTHWWWGRLGRLDTLMLLSRHDKPAGCTRSGDGAPMAGPHLRQAAIAEVAAFDVGLALHLAEAWDGDTATLSAAVLEYSSGQPDLSQYGPVERQPSTGRPGAGLISAWSHGACDVWADGVVVSHAVVLAKVEPDQLVTRVWRAQAATLLPLLEEQRHRVVAWLEARGHGTRLAQCAGQTPVEIGTVWYYMKHRAGMAGVPQMALVNWLRTTRNAVAHLRCVSPAQISEGLDLIARTSL